MQVDLLTYTPNPEEIVAAAAKLCYSKSDIATLLDNMTPEKTEAFIKKLASMGHESPFEHITFTFGIEDVSRSLLAQITRHRIASYSVQSQRYVHDDFGYVTPPAIAEDGYLHGVFLEAMFDSMQTYERLADGLQKRYVEQGMDAKAAEKKAIEDARYVLPNATCTKMIVTMNARSLFNFFQHRCCNRSQWEIRELADTMLQLVKNVAPNVFAKAGAPCTYGHCPEGAYSCGHPRKDV